MCIFLVAHRFVMQFNTCATLDIYYMSKFVMSACLVSQQTHEACHASRVHVLSTIHMAHQKCMALISYSQAQLQYNYYNIKRALVLLLVMTALYKCLQRFWTIAGTSEYTCPLCTCGYRYDHVQVTYIKIQYCTTSWMKDMYR